MSAVISFACKAKLSSECLDWADKLEPGVHRIPASVMPSRQIVLKPELKGRISSYLEWHRDTYLSVIARHYAEELVANALADWVEDQSLVVYSKDQYLADPHVKGNPKEFKRVSDAICGSVIVAVVGKRSALTVCRNIRDGIQDTLDNLVKYASEACEASNFVLVEGLE